MEIAPIIDIPLGKDMDTCFDHLQNTDRDSNKVIIYCLYKRNKSTYISTNLGIAKTNPAKLRLNRQLWATM